MPRIISPAMEAKLSAAMRPAARKTAGLPKGFKRHRGGKCPVDPNSYVEPLIRTSEGIGSGGIVRASDHEWSSKHHKDGLGAIVAYRPAVRGEPPTFHGHDRFKVKGIE